MSFLLAVLLALAGFQDSPQSGTGAIEGVVTRAGTSQPIANARVALWGDRGPDFETRTDANGHYVLSNLAAGIFNVEIQAEGYQTEPNSSKGIITRLKVEAQQRVRHNVVLSPYSSISGSIFDENREPLGGVTVEVLQLNNDLRGRVQWRQVDFLTTDEKGEYRFESLPPGDYYVRASQKPALTMTFFPGTLDARTAASILLRDGGDKRAEFPLVKGRTYTIAGTIKNEDSSPVGQVVLFAVPQDPRIPIDSLLAAGVPVKDTFELKGLLPGAYDISALSSPSHSVRPTIRVDAEHGQATVLSTQKIDIPMRAAKGFAQISDRDVRDVSLLLQAGGDVSGHVRIAGNEGRPVELGSLPIRLGLQRRSDILSGIARAGQMDSKGDSFKFTDVAPGIHDVMVMPQGPMPGNLYLADVRVAGRSVFDDGLEVTRVPNDSVEVLIGFDGGGVEGRINTTRKSLAFVALVPQASRRQNPSRYRGVGMTDSSEPFSIAGVAPGIYSLFAFELEALDETVPFMSPDFLARYESRSVPVTIEKGAVVSPAPLSLIPKERH